VIGQGGGVNRDRLSRAEQLAVIRQALSVTIATGLYGVSFGALAQVAGLSLPQIMVLSMVMFTGGSQFALIGVVGSGGLASAAVAAAALLGARNTLYGLQMGPVLALNGWRRLLAAQLTIDESCAVAMAQPSPTARRLGFWWTGLGVWVAWNACTFLGVRLGQSAADPRAWGLDAAAAAAFLALLWPRLSDRRSRWSAGLAVLVALALTPVTAPGVPVLAAAGAVLLFNLLRDRRPR
jgi:predicted branched-subunit amino acid permease